MKLRLKNHFYSVGYCLAILFSLACSNDSDSDSEPPVPFPTEPGLGLLLPEGGKVIDDFRSCEADYKTQIDTYWYTFNDEFNGGDSTSAIELSSDGLLEKACSLSWQGKVTTTFIYGFSGLGFDLGDLQLDSYAGIYLLLRGDGRNQRLKLPMSAQINADETDFFGSNIACGDGSGNWLPVTLDFANFQQEGWGISTKLELSDVAKIQFQTIGQPITGFQCEIAAVVLVK